MNCGETCLFGRASPFATAFPPDLPYPIMVPSAGRGGGARDGGLSGQRVCPQRPHGLSAGPLRRPAGGESLSGGGRYVLAGVLGGAYAAAVFLPGLSFLAAVPAKLAAGALLALIAFGGEEKLLRLTLLFFRRLLRHGRVRAGPGAAGGGRRPHGRRRFLYGCGCQGPVDRRRGGLSGADSGVPGRGPPRRSGRAGDGAAVPPGAGDRIQGPLRHRKQPPGPGLRRTGACGVSGVPG